MLSLEDIQPSLRIAGVIPGEAVTAISVSSHGPDTVELIYKTAEGKFDTRILGRDAETNLSIAEAQLRPLDADASAFRLVAECQRIKLAGFSDPMLAVTTSAIEPLPHQLRAVYGELLPRTPLRFLLADDPGAGKTIMAGLYIKELKLREDVKRCLVVAPGGLVEQWQDELYLKFGLQFEILTRGMGETVFVTSAFEQHPFLIARMDQLSRNEDLQAELAKSEWDLVIVDEAHRMGARYFGNELRKTKRFQLGEELGLVTRHLLLMTATPHSGIEEDFQLFLTLLDRDRFEGKFRPTTQQKPDTEGIMRRMIKEDLLTFEGKPLFPERIAETVPYQLTDIERDLYEQVTTYVREGMNRAAKLDGKRRNTVGFALTVLQRRLASSPEAIYRSLERRAARLERRKQLVLAGGSLEEPKPPASFDTEDEFDDEEFSAEELEEMEDELLDAATAARTVEELEIEIAELHGLTEAAAVVRASDTDRKWSELRTILEDKTLVKDGSDARRKLIVFTEHRDTLDYLKARISSLIGRPEAVKAIHGGVSRSERRRITEEFTHNPDCQILLATDAAGEGLNLQVAHLMVNYDLPWNPNRIEQRFGRIHRIGQQEVCRLWNLVATGTREGDVFDRLLAKVEEQRKAYGGKVFDVLGNAFGETPLRKLLLEAIQYGELPETKAKLDQVIDASVSKGIHELLEEQALASDAMQKADIAELRLQMDEARARRLQPYYIEGAFRRAFAELGGRISKREKGRFEIKHVPAAIRNSAPGPVASAYHRVTFDLEHVVADGVRAEVLAPGHPLHDAVAEMTIARHHDVLERGTVLVSPLVYEPSLLVGVMAEVIDATDTSVARRFTYAYISEDGSVREAGPAPYLDSVPAPDTAAVEAARGAQWLTAAEDKAKSWVIANRLGEYLEEVRLHRGAELERVRDQVDARLHTEYERLQMEALLATEKEQQGKKPKESSTSLAEKAKDLEARRKKRMALLAKQLEMQARPPRVVTAALVLPPNVVEEAPSSEPPPHAVETKEVERRGVDLVLKTEADLGRKPIEQAFNNPGFDVLSEQEEDDPIRIEVKARLAGAKDFSITHNELLTAKNTVPRYRLALVRVDPRGPEHDEVRYVANPFVGFDAGAFDAVSHRGKWDETWAKGKEPF